MNYRRINSTLVGAVPTDVQAYFTSMAGREIIVPVEWVIDASVDASGVALTFVDNGKITVTAGHTVSNVTVTGMPDWKIFDGDGSVTIKSGSSRPEWFGASTASSYQTNTTAIQKATNALSAHGGVVKYGVGVWLQGSVIPVSNVSYQGLGEATVIKLGDGANSALFNRNNTSINLATAQNNITFSDFVIDGNKANAFINDYNASAIQIGGSNITIKNIRAYNTIAAMCSIGVNVTGAKNIRILNCVVHNPGTINRYWGGIAVINGSDVLMSGNVITTSDGYMQYGLDYEPNSAWERGIDISIENNVVIRGTINVSVASNVSIKNNVVRMPLNNAGGGASVRVGNCTGILAIEGNNIEQYIVNNACLMLDGNAFTTGFVSGNQFLQRCPYQSSENYLNSQALRIVDTSNITVSSNEVVYPGDIQYYSRTQGGGIIEIGSSNSNTFFNNIFVNIYTPYALIGASSVVKCLEQRQDGTYHLDSTVAVKNGAEINVLLNKNGDSYINDRLVINGDTYHGSGGAFIQAGVETYGGITVRGSEGPNTGYDPDMINPANLNLFGSNGTSAHNDGGEAAIDMRANGAYSNLDYAKIIKYANGINSGVLEIRCGAPAASPALVITPVYTGSPNVGIGKVPTVKLDVDGPINSQKVKLTAEGGIAVLMTNRTGGASVKGEVVTVSSSYDNAVSKIVVDVPNPVGVFYESGIADGAEAWIVVSGVADVYFIGNTTRGQFGRGFVTGDAGYVSGQAFAENVPTAPFATDKHFYEICHITESRTGAGLAKGVLHFN